MKNEERILGREMHHRQVRGDVLTAIEQAQLAAFLLAVEQEETRQREPASNRAEERIAAKARRNQELQALAERHQALVDRLRVTLIDAESERTAIWRERERIESAAL